MKHCNAGDNEIAFANYFDTIKEASLTKTLENFRTARSAQKSSLTFESSATTTTGLLDIGPNDDGVVH